MVDYSFLSDHGTADLNCTAGLESAENEQFFFSTVPQIRCMSYSDLPL